MIEQQDEVTDLIQRVEELALRYSYTFNGKPRVASALKLLTSEVCERKILSMLSHPTQDVKHFDPLYKERSDFATRFIIDCIKNALEERGLDATISTEQRSPEGVYDLVVRLKPPTSQEGKKVVIRIEVKASLGLELEQVQRYLLDSSPLVLVRVIPGHILLLTRDNVRHFIEVSHRIILAKIKRLENGQPFTIAGPHCYGCREFDCPYNPRQENKEEDHIVMPADPIFNQEMKLFFKNLPVVAERVASIVCELLSSGA